MVFFCCDGCGETMKKARVDGHAAKCRECYTVSCVDCSQKFYGDEYRNHTSCISEAERYEKTIFRGARKLDESGTGHRGQQQQGKKLNPQEKWNITIQAAAETAPESLKSYLDQLAMCENVPRKQKQFCNFTVNSLGLRGPRGDKVKGEIWTLLVKAREEEKKIQEAEAKERKQLAESTKKKEVIASESSEDDQSTASIDDMPSKKEATKAMKKVLKKAPNRRLKFKVLRKQVQESLSIKAKGSGEKKLKKLLQECVDANPKKLVVDGKTVTLS